MFSDLGLGDKKKKLWKWPVDWSFSERFFKAFFKNISRKTVKLER